MSFAKCAVLLLASSLAGQTAPKAVVSPQSVTKGIALRGAKQEVRKLQVTGHWRAVLGGIQSGSAEWLEAAKQLHAGTDAGLSEELQFSVAMALTKNAQAVLEKSAPEFPLDAVCSVPYIEPSEKVIAAHRAKVHAALGKVTVPALQDKKAACLKTVDAH